eukprot:6195632-Pleurochrysis_carterae.AAC.1
MASFASRVCNSVENASAAASVAGRRRLRISAVARLCTDLALQQRADGQAGGRTGGMRRKYMPRIYLPGYLYTERLGSRQTRTITHLALQ